MAKKEKKYEVTAYITLTAKNKKEAKKTVRGILADTGTDFKIDNYVVDMEDE